MNGRKHLPEGARLVLVLTLAGLFSGLAIVGAHEVTLPRIRANQAAAIERAVLEVLPGAERMERFDWRDGELVAAGDEAGGAAVADGAPAIYAGYGPGGERIGYAVPGEGAGFQDVIRLLFGYRPERRRIVGLAILESRETPGLGDRIFKDPEFVAEFSDLAVEPTVELVKDGGDQANQVDAITGATISSRAVVDIVNEAAGEWLGRLPADGVVADGAAADDAGSAGGAGGGDG